MVVAAGSNRKCRAHQPERHFRESGPTRCESALLTTNDSDARRRVGSRAEPPLSPCPARYHECPSTSLAWSAGALVSSRVSHDYVSVRSSRGAEGGRLAARRCRPARTGWGRPGRRRPLVEWPRARPGRRARACHLIARSYEPPALFLRRCCRAAAPAAHTAAADHRRARRVAKIYFPRTGSPRESCAGVVNQLAAAARRLQRARTRRVARQLLIK
jgi:hypothetical protein